MQLFVTICMSKSSDFYINSLSSIPYVPPSTDLFPTY